jgi:hypothetical protein
MGAQYVDYLERTVESQSKEIAAMKKVLVCPINLETRSEFCSAGCCYKCLLERAKNGRGENV